MITSTSNQRMKEIVQLQKKSRARNQMGVFIVEGIRMVREVPAERLVQLYTTEEFYKKHKEELPGKDGKPIRAELVSPAVFEHISDTKTPQGVLAVVRQSQYTEEEILGNALVEESAGGKTLRNRERQMPEKEGEGTNGAPLILALDNLQDPGNLGTIFRTAEAAGVTGIIMSRDCVDIYNPKTIRSTMGAVFRMPFIYVEDLPESIKKLQSNGVQVYAAHLDGKHFYDEEDYRGGAAFLIGNEGNGLRQEVAECADTWIRIPMEGQAESLNAAVAASILMFEAGRQRRRN